MLLTFLSASVPLTKTITNTNGVITKDSYPLQSKFTSNSVEVDSVAKLFEAIKQMSQHKDKPCLLKGTLAQPLVNESRKHSTRTNTPTALSIFDLDSAPFNNPDEYMKSVGLGDISYVVQYSSSYKLNKKDKTLSCHIFCLLSEARPAPELKAWLMHLNLTTEVLKQALTLSNSQVALHWPLDITCCQNDKLIYIAEPTFVGMQSPVPIDERIQLVKRELDAIPVERIALRPMDALKKEQRRILNELQTAAGITPTKAKTKMVGEYEVQTGVGEIAQYNIIDCGEYNRIDLNGGDSRAYYHRKDDPTYLHNFKGEPSVLLKEILPQYYADLVRDRSNQDATPLADGQTLLLAYRDKVTADYYKGTWNETTQVLDLNKVKSRDQLADFLMGHGRQLGDFVPEWQTVFDPAREIVVDEVEHILNRFQPSHYMKEANQKKGNFPSIQRLIDSAVGTGPIQVHFVNWLAYMFQFKKKPMTSWVLHGTFGCLTGDTVIGFNRGSRNGIRNLTIKEAYEKWTGTYKLGTGRGKGWDMSLPTYTKSVVAPGQLKLNRVLKIIQSGVKQVYTLTTSSGKSVRATAEHPFMRPGGTFTKLSKLRIGDEILAEGTAPTAGAKRKKHQRKTTYSIPYHPYAWDHYINGKNYKRSHTARLIVEAHQNGLTLDELISILRTDKVKAASLKYIPADHAVHHRNHVESDDALNNLEVMTSAQHDAHHSSQTTKRKSPTAVERVISITKGAKEMTYDIAMEAPHNNYVANGLVVHNTGKGMLVGKVIAPLFGHEYVHQMRASELNEQFNGWLENSLVVFIDEIDAGMFTNPKSTNSNLKKYITDSPLTIRRMRTDSYMVPNFTGFIFGSNEKQPVYVPMGDRRYNVGSFQSERYFPTDDELDAMPGEIKHFAHFLQHYKVSDKAAHSVLQTEEREAIQQLGMTSIDQLANDLLEGNLGGMLEALPDTQLMDSMGVVNPTSAAYINIVKRFAHEPVSRITRDELAVLFTHCVGKVPEGAHKFTAFLRHHGITTKVLRVGNETPRGLEVKWKITADDREFIAQAFPNKPAKLKAVK